MTRTYHSSVYLVVYDVKDKEMPVFYGTYKEVADYFNTSIGVIQCNVCRQYLRENRYRIEKVII